MKKFVLCLERYASKCNKLTYNEIKVRVFLPPTDWPEHKSLLKPQYPVLKLKCQISSLSLHRALFQSGERIDVDRIVGLRLCTINTRFCLNIH